MAALLLTACAPPAGPESPDAERRDLLLRVAETGTFTNPRGHHAAALLPTGEALIVGGMNALTVLDSAFCFNEATGWSRCGGLPGARPASGLAARVMRNGVLLTAGGAKSTAQPDVHLVDPRQPWRASAWDAGQPLGHHRALHTLSLLEDGRVLAAGGPTLAAA